MKKIFLWKTLPDPWRAAGFAHTGLIVAGADGSYPGVLRDDGTREVFTAESSGGPVGAKVFDYLAQTDLVWARRVESRSALGSLDPRYVSVALSSDASTVQTVVVDDAGVLREANDIGLPTFVDRATVAHPVARTDFDLLLSSVAQGLVLVGGRNSSGDLQDVWFRRIGSDWRKVADGAFARLLDVTVSSNDGTVWILDRLDDGMIRLQTLSLETGYEQEVGTWTPSASFNTFALSVDRDGVPLLAASSASGARIGRLALDGTKAILTQYGTSSPAFSVRPIVDPSGYAFVRDLSDGSSATQRRGSLELGSVGSYDVKNVFP